MPCLRNASIAKKGKNCRRKVGVSLPVGVCVYARTDLGVEYTKLHPALQSDRAARLDSLHLSATMLEKARPPPRAKGRSECPQPARRAGKTSDVGTSPLQPFRSCIYPNIRYNEVTLESRGRIRTSERDAIPVSCTTALFFDLDPPAASAPGETTALPCRLWSARLEQLMRSAGRIFGLTQPIDATLAEFIRSEWRFRLNSHRVEM